MSLEEYIKFLEDEKDYTAKVNGVKYYVQYVENTNQAKIPDSTKHEVSGDNLNGFIITSILK